MDVTVRLEGDKAICLPSVSTFTKGICMFAIYTTIVMIIGILIVCYTSPKPPGILIFYNTL
ncbi:hypothetical protein I4U23_026469 [Adineta vaga]|nr:hypothetical protein I4U23_026469 [Adineta vaga]